MSEHAPAGRAELLPVARAIHEALGGDGWAYTNYGADEWNSKREELLNAAQAAIAAWNTRVGPASTDMAELQRLSEEATPGPWVFAEENVGTMFDAGYGLLYGEPGAGGWEKNLYISVGCSGNVDRELGENVGKANAAFIVACVNYVRAQLASPSHPDTRLREAVEGVVAELEQEHEYYTRDPLDAIAAAVGEAYSDAASRLQHVLAESSDV